MAVVKVGRKVGESVRNAVRLAGGLERIVQRHSTVLVKPNLWKPSESGSGIITDTRVTEAVTRLVMEQKPDRVIIGEGAAVGYDVPNIQDTMVAFRKSKTREVAERLGVELIDLNRDTPVEVHLRNAFVMKKFKVAKTALDADTIISVPVLKTHFQTGITCGLKNMKGVLPGFEKRRTHRMGLDKAIVDLNRIVKPKFVVVDAINCMQGTWDLADDKVNMNLIVAGDDAVAVDSVCARIIGLDIDRIMHVNLAQKAGLGVADPVRIDVKGERIESVTRKFLSFSGSFQAKFGALDLIEKNACTGCTGELPSTLRYLCHAGVGEKLAQLTLIMGNPEEVRITREVCVVIGQCAKRYAYLGVYVPGCPPNALIITDRICEAMNINKRSVHRIIRELHSKV